MKTIIAGSRTVTDYRWVQGAIDDAVSKGGLVITEVLPGGAAGADRLGERWAREHGVPVRVFPADWDRHGKAAGPIRDGQMATEADALVAVWDGQSRGTADVIRQATAKGLKVLTYRID